ncbi:HD domain-containing protein [Ochrobactrum sp. GPK 3]|uniref:HD domain-containing protein n=1 Tax=Brucella sp. 22210 TaxID=3453892 RepID=UPI0031385A0E
MQPKMEHPVDMGRLEGIVQFIQAAERLKSTLRSGHTAEGRPESTAEHSWRLCLLVTLFDKELGDCDRLRLLKMCLVHDLGEAISGDVPAIHQSADDGRAEREKADLIQLCAPLPDDLRAEILDLWADYNRGTSPEAIFAKGFDKIETMLQHNIGLNPPDFDYAFNLGYGLKQTERHPLLRQFRTLVDAQTARNADKQKRSV